jgi:hypothetical protein
MESKRYDVRDRGWVGILAGLTFGILDRAGPARDAAGVTAHPVRRPPGLLDRLDTWFWKQELASREAFLAKSADIVELEQRMRWLEHGRC